MSHTPGPWHLVCHTGEVVTDAGDDWTIYGPDKKIAICYEGNHWRDPNAAANSKLIQHAPDLLVAIKILSNAVEFYGSVMHDHMVSAEAYQQLQSTNRHAIAVALRAAGEKQ